MLSFPRACGGAAVALTLFAVVTKASATDGWPRSFTGDGATVTVYQPQITSWSGNTLTSRAAVSVLPAGAAAPQFGTVELSGTTDVDNEAQTLSLSNFQVIQSTFPSAPAQAASYGAMVAGSAEKWAQNVSLPAVRANLAVTTAEGGSKAVAVQNPVPTIIFSEASAVLVLVDGDPALRTVNGTTLLRAINTQAVLVLDKSSGLYYLRVNGGWAQASALNGPWTVAANPPASLAGVLQQATAAGNVETFDPPSSSPAPPMPQIYVSTTPAELITTQGAPQFNPVPNTQLLQVKNSESSLFMSLANQNYYVVISGRWFNAPALTGPWQFTPANQLPADFANIPETAPAGTVLASVAGTPQASEAAISASIPQTATVKRSTTTTVSYDGDPQFVPITGTDLSYAKNTPLPVIRVASDKYYVVVNGVWFKAKSPAGPWVVAESVPPVIYTIPPSSPVFYVTNVYVYAANDTVVYTGYTPGYFGPCVSTEGVVVFGTGYTYQPYIGTSVWYGPPLTYGFGAGFACGLATGFAFGLAADHGWGCSPWWGPWHGGWGNNNVNVNVNRNVQNNWNNVNVNKTNVYNRWGNNVVNTGNISKNTVNNISKNQINANNDGDRYNNWKESHNTVQNGDNNRAVDRSTVQKDSSRLGDNNVFAGKDGQVYRPQDNGNWQRNDNGRWSDVDRSTMDSSNRQYLDSQRGSRSVGGFRSGGGGGGGGRFR